MSTPALDREIRRRSRYYLLRAIDNLRTAIEKDFPSAVTMLGMMIVLRRMLVLHGAALADALAKELLARARLSYGVCDLCGEQPLVAAKGMCDRCWASAERTEFEASDPEGSVQ